MGYSKESVRQNEALKDALAGREHVKNYVQVGYEGKQKPKGDVIPKMTEIMKDVRMPLFCPKCDKVMKKRLDNKMWNLYQHCFDCQVEIENKMRIDGTYKEWEEKKVKANTLSWIKEQKKTIEEFKKQKSPEFYQQFRPDGYSIDKEKWEMDMSLVMKQADEALEHLQKVEDSLK